MQKIQFYAHDRNPVLKERKRLKKFIVNLFIIENRLLDNLTYIFCSDEHLLSINVKFLKHDFYTDVITFELGSNQKETSGEVYLSIDRIRDNAKNEGTSFNEELHRVIFHGALHLCGYNDKTKPDLLTMRAMEDKYLNLYFSH